MGTTILTFLYKLQINHLGLILNAKHVIIAESAVRVPCALNCQYPFSPYVLADVLESKVKAAESGSLTETLATLFCFSQKLY